jgi:DNA-binding beta-propeller fold protein YncE
MRLRLNSPSLFIFSTLVLIGCDGGSSVSPDNSDMTTSADMTSTGKDMTPPTNDMGSTGDDMGSTGGDAGASATTLSFVAGSFGGFGNTNGIGAAARFNGPQGVASDGNFLYIADTNNHLIRKMELSTGEVTTLAGQTNSNGNNDGTGTGALFSYPQGVLISGTTLYVADTGNCTIRTVNPSTGEVSTIAGKMCEFNNPSADGIGDLARFNGPIGLAIKGTNLYVADASNHTIRKLDLSTRQVITLAGHATAYGYVDATGDAARFSGPTGLAIDSAGATLYVADKVNNKIRTVDTSTGAVGTVKDAGGVPAALTSPTGVALDGTAIYVTEGGFIHYTVRKLDIATGTLSPFAGQVGADGDNVDGIGDAARFNTPSGLVFDGSNLYVADYGNNTIRKISVSTTEVSTVAGAAGHFGSADGTGSQAQFSAPYGVVSDGQDNLYVADSGNNTIRKVKISTGEVTTIAGTAGMGPDPSIDPTLNGDGTGVDARFSNPQGLALRGTNLYIADQYSNIIRKMDLSTGVVSTIAGAADPGNVDPSTGQNGAGAAARFLYPAGLTLDDAGNLYVSDSYNYTIRKIVIPATGDAVVSTIAGTAGMLPDFGSNGDGIGAAARFAYPQGLASDGVNVYVVDNGLNTIRKVTIPATGDAVVTTLAGMAGESGYVDQPGAAARFSSPFGLACDHVGNLYVADQFNNTVRRVSIGSGQVHTFAGAFGTVGAGPGPLPGGLDAPTALTVVSPTQVVIADENAIFITN